MLFPYHLVHEHEKRNKDLYLYAIFGQREMEGKEGERFGGMEGKYRQFLLRIQSPFLLRIQSLHQWKDLEGKHSISFLFPSLLHKQGVLPFLTPLLPFPSFPSPFLSFFSLLICYPNTLLRLDHQRLRENMMQHLKLQFYFLYLYSLVNYMINSRFFLHYSFIFYSSWKQSLHNYLYIGLYLEHTFLFDGSIRQKLQA